MKSINRHHKPKESINMSALNEEAEEQKKYVQRRSRPTLCAVCTNPVHMIVPVNAAHALICR